MPVVDGKHYPYTKEGKRKAAEAKKKKKNSGGSPVDKAFSKKY